MHSLWKAGEAVFSVRATIVLADLRVFQECGALRGFRSLWSRGRLACVEAGHLSLVSRDGEWLDRRSRGISLDWNNAPKYPKSCLVDKSLDQRQDWGRPYGKNVPGA